MRGSDPDKTLPAGVALDFTPIAFSPGTLVAGRFEIRKTIGRGPSAIVYAALDRADRIEVALKLLVPRLGYDRELALRLQRELRTATEIFHPRFVNIRNADEWNGGIYVAMEIVAGRLLKGDVERRGPLPRGQALKIVYDVALALRALHQERISHRAVWPRNVLVESDLQPKLMDFAGSRARAILGKTGLPDLACYLPPEECDPRLHGDSRSDVYNLGCMLFELLTGRAPFPLGITMAEVAAHQRPDPPDLRELQPDTPDWVAGIVEKALALQAAERHPDIDAFVSDLEATARETDISQDVEELIRDIERKKKARTEREAAFAKEIPPPLELPEPEVKKKAAVRRADYSPAEIAKRRRTWLAVSGIFGAAVLLAVLLHLVLRIGRGGDDAQRTPVDPGRIGMEDKVRLALDGFRDDFPGDDEGHIEDLTTLGVQTLTVLRKATSDPNANVRLNVARVLGLIAPDDAREDLERLATDPEPRVRQAALASVARVTTGVSPDVVARALRSGEPEEQRLGLDLMAKGLGQAPGDAVAPLLASSDVSLRAAAVTALGRAKAADAVPLLKQALGDESPSVRAGAASSLASFASEETASAMLPLLEDDRRVAEAAAATLAVSMPPALKQALAEKATAEVPRAQSPYLSVALVRAGHEPLSTALRGALQSTDPAARAYAALVLSTADDRGAVPPLVESLAVRRTRYAQRPFLVALLRLGHEATKDRVVGELSSPDERRLAFAAGVLAEAGNPAAVPALATAMSKVRPGAPQRLVSHALARLGTLPRGSDAHLASSSREERRDAVLAYALAGYGTRLPRILAIRDEEPDILQHDVALGLLGHRATLAAYTGNAATGGPVEREKAAQFFGALGQRRHFGAVAALLKDERPSVRREACRAIGDLFDPRGIAALAPLLNDPDPDVRTAAMAAAYRLGDEGIVDRAAADLKAPKPEERAQACRRLGVIGSPLAIPYLMPLLQDGAKYGKPVKRPSDLTAPGRVEEAVPRVRDAAAEALATIMGTDSGFDPFAFEDSQTLALERLRANAADRSPGRDELL